MNKLAIATAVAVSFGVGHQVGQIQMASKARRKIMSTMPLIINPIV